MRLNVYYGTIKKTFVGDEPYELFDQARADKLYKGCNDIIYELEEVNEDGDKCCEC